MLGYFTRIKGATLTDLLRFIAGVVLLGVGANWLVRGAATIAMALKIPKHVAGLTLVALGTSAPELFFNLIAAYHDETEFALANISGSNLANLCIGFGICALTAKLVVRRNEFSSDLMLVWISPAVVWFMLAFTGTLPFWSIVPLSLMLAYYLRSLRGRDAVAEEHGVLHDCTVAGGRLFCAGIACLYFGGNFILEAARETAKNLGVGEDIIGLTVVAFCTSVPDITASVVAARRNEMGIAVGNILGSNISNLVLVLNGTVVVSQSSLPVELPVSVDYLAVTLLSIAFCWLAFKKEAVSRSMGIGLIAIYLIYLGARVATM